MRMIKLIGGNMDYNKPYRFEVKNQEGILINGSSGIKMYKIDSTDLPQSLLKVKLLKSDSWIKIPFNRIEKASMQSIRLYYPEWFI
jgi:hypothetical protein